MLDYRNVRRRGVHTKRCTSRAPLNGNVRQGTAQTTALNESDSQIPGPKLTRTAGTPGHQKPLQ